MGMGSTFCFFCSERGLLKKIIKNRPSFGTQTLTNFFYSIQILTAQDVFPLRSLDIIMDTDMRAQAPRTLSDPYIHR
jgi:hypothetical protein